MWRLKVREYLSSEHDCQKVVDTFTELRVMRAIFLESFHSSSHICSRKVYISQHCHRTSTAWQIVENSSPVSLPACNALYSSAAACSNLEMLCDFSSDSCVRVTSASESTCTVCYGSVAQLRKRKRNDTLTRRFSISFNKTRWFWVWTWSPLFWDWI